jgi:hypothetical protein
MDFNRVEGNFFQEHHNDAHKLNFLNSNSFHMEKKLYDERHKEEYNRDEECQHEHEHQHQHDTLCNNINFFDCNASSAFDSFLILPHEHDSPPFMNTLYNKHENLNI